MNNILEKTAEWCPLTFEYDEERSKEVKGRKNRTAP